MDKAAMVQALVEKYTGGNKAQFANMLGVSAQTVSAWIARKTFDAELIYTKCIGVSANWLLTGKGEMQDAPVEVLASGMQKIEQGGIPLIPIDAMAGMFQGEQSVLLAECERYFVPAFKSADFLITVRGDSMQPRYCSGDIVACKNLSLSDIFFQWGKVYVVDTEQGSLIKKVEQGTRNDTIMLVSENPLYKPFEIAKKSIYHIAIVLGVIRAE